MTDLALQRSERALDADRRLRGLFADAAPTPQGSDPREASGMALVAVGGYGRSELSPFSDLDVVLLHDPSVPEDVVHETANKIWYPLWNDGVALDHSVRDTTQMREAALDDHRAAMGMLDARPVAGDSNLVLTLRSHVLADWRRDARRRLPEVHDADAKRVERAGWLAYAGVPDLKESGGGLRDGVTMRALVATWLVDVPHGELEALRLALLDVRDTLHQVSGRRVDKLTPESIVEVATVLGEDPERLDLHTRSLGRRIAHLSSLAWRRVDETLDKDRAVRRVPTGPAVQRLAAGVGLLDDEVVLASDADPAGDPEVALRAAAAAATGGHVLSSTSATRLARELGELPEPWPESSRRLMVDLLTAGENLLPVWDELDISGVVDHWLPEWAAIRLRGSSSPVHMYTVDRHSVQTCVEAVESQRDVSRPDLLAVAALLHDIGKGREGDHSDVGAPMAEGVAQRWGFDAADAALIGRLVQWHLVLPTIATRRDIEDPATAHNVAEIVQDEDALDLLATLTEADAEATSPQAWSSWRRGLVRGLVDKVHEVLDQSTPTPDPQEYAGWPQDLPLPDDRRMASDELVLTADPHHGGSLVTVTTADRPGIMASLAGGLALTGLEIRSARVYTHEHAAVSLWEVTREDVDSAKIAERLRPVLAGDVDLAARLALKKQPGGAAPRVRVLKASSETATLVEVRAHDHRGLIWDVCRTIAGLGHSIRSAHVSTYGTEARDVFYVVDAEGEKLDASESGALQEAVQQVLTDV